MYYSTKFGQSYSHATLNIELANVIEVLKDRILPEFSKISDESMSIRNQRWDKLTSLPSAGDDDLSDFMEPAFDAGYEHYSLMFGLSQGVVNLFAVSLFHIHEQHLMIFYKWQLHNLRAKLDPKKLKPYYVITHLEELGIKVKELPSWQSLKEVELLANAIKHGEGDAAQALRKKQPKFFIDPKMPSDLELGPPLYLDKPLLGEGIYVTLHHLEDIERIIVTFWSELLEALKQHEYST